MEEAKNRGARMAPRGFFPVMAAMGPGIVLSLGVVDRSHSAAVNLSQRIVQIIFLVGVLVTYLLMPERPEKLVILSQYIIGLVGTPIAIIVIFYLAFQTDRRVRMNRVTGLLFVVSVAIILICVGVGFAYSRGWIDKEPESAASRGVPPRCSAQAGSAVALRQKPRDKDESTRKRRGPKRLSIRSAGESHVWHA